MLRPLLEYEGGKPANSPALRLQAANPNGLVGAWFAPFHRGRSIWPAHGQDQCRLAGRQAEIHAARDRKLEEARRQRQLRRQQTASWRFAPSSTPATMTSPGETEAGSAGRQPC